jgi:murein L,D-transpeptidase YcbB/YkuD
MPSSAHTQANPTSDHEWGNAADLTHDPANGVDCSVLSRELIDDPRVKYIIFNSQIYRTYKTQLGWAKYTGKNKHKSHMHVSIHSTARDDLRPWPWSPESSTLEPEPTKPAVLRIGSRGPEVKRLQERLIELGYAIKADSIFGNHTAAAVELFQALHGLETDGTAGPATRKMLQL